MEFSKPICHSSQSVIVTTGIIYINLKPLYFRPQSIPRLQYIFIHIFREHKHSKTAITLSPYAYVPPCMDMHNVFIRRKWHAMCTYHVFMQCEWCTYDVFNDTRCVRTMFSRSASDVHTMNPDRVVTIKGALSSVCAAIDKVYSKLKSCFEADLQSVKVNVRTLISLPMYLH